MIGGQTRHGRCRRGLGEQDVLTLNAWATQGLFPDLVVLLHIDPTAGLARALQDGADRFEAEDLAFHARVSDAYLRIAEEHPDRVAVVDASGTPEEVHARVRPALDRVLTGGEEGTAGQGEVHTVLIQVVTTGGCRSSYRIAAR